MFTLIVLLIITIVSYSGIAHQQLKILIIQMSQNDPRYISKWHHHMQSWKCYAAEHNYDIFMIQKRKTKILPILNGRV